MVSSKFNKIARIQKSPPVCKKPPVPIPLGPTDCNNLPQIAIPYHALVDIQHPVEHLLFALAGTMTILNHNNWFVFTLAPPPPAGPLSPTACLFGIKIDEADCSFEMAWNVHILGDPDPDSGGASGIFTGFGGGGLQIGGMFANVHSGSVLWGTP